MIKHIVMIKLKSFSTEKDKALKIKEIKEGLEGLKNLIKEIKFIEIGVNINPSERASDLVLLSDFDSLESLEVYRVHPEHQKVLKIISENAEKVTAVDYEW